MAGRGVWPAGGTALHQREDARELGRLRQAGLRGDRARARRGLPARLHAQAASLMGLVANQPLAPYLFIQRRGRVILRTSPHASNPKQQQRYVVWAMCQISQSW